MRCIHKKGSSHLEIIISFVLFMGFTMFLLFSIQPTKKDLLEESILLGLKNRFFDNVVTNVSGTLVNINQTINVPASSNRCIEGACKPTEFTGPSIVDVGVPARTCFHYVVSSSEFVSSPGQLSLCSSGPRNYTLGYIEKQQVISNKSLQVMQKKYYENYGGLKTDLGVPDVVDFAIISSNNFSMSKTVPDDAEVIAAMYRKGVLYSNGSIVNQDFIVKVW